MRSIILFHNTTYYLKLHYLDLIQCFLRQGWTVCCAAPRDAATAGLESEGVRCIDVTLSRRGMNPFDEAAALGRLYRIFRRERPDAVLNFSIKPAIYGSVAAGLAGVPRVCSMITGLGYVFLGRGPLRAMLSAAAGWGYRTALGRNYRVFFQNPDDRDFFLRRRIVQPGQDVVLNGTGVDTKRFAPVDGPDTSRGVRFLMVARLLADKGIREFVDAAAHLKRSEPRVRCSLLGPRDDNPSVIDPRELKQWIDSGTIEYLGETEDVAGVIADHHVFVLPSYREGLPRATLEAMSMGKPVVTTDVPGCRETVENGVNGFLVPSGNAVALRRAMERFVDDPELIRSMGKASRTMVLDKFDVHVVNRHIVGVVTRGLGHESE
ncbi:MAG: glycosyltransferase family 4 protein [Gammaproteobacteria bacterium]|nr:glycosyltransferase family 4 protein [Gammaproteobacteria bacterium]